MTRDLKALPDPAEAAEWIGPVLGEACLRVREAGGRALLVGGAVRDALLDHRSSELDFEVRGLTIAALRDVLSEIGEVIEVGRSFGVLRLRHVDADFALPRRDSREGRGHRGIRAEVDPHLDPVVAARRRDLTVNALSYDPLDGELIDPLGGLEDLRAGRLRACDPATFGEDPLRALRVMQLSARLLMEPDDELLEICAQQQLDELSDERIFDEFRKLLVQGLEPSRGLEFLRRTELLRYFPPLEALIDVPQDPHWHPEGDVWVHTLMVVDEAARLRSGDEDDLALMFGALCHDLGKAVTTHVDREGRVRSPAHDAVGEKIALDFLAGMRAPSDLIGKVRSLTREHLAPALFVEQDSSDRAWRRLSRRLARSGTSMELLVRLARADHLGRTTEEARQRIFPAGDAFLERARALSVDEASPADVVQGRHLLKRGMKPGPELGQLLDRCRCVQDETGWTDPDQILDRVLGEGE